MASDLNEGGRSGQGLPPGLTVLIADDHPLFCAGVRQAIESVLALKVVAECRDGEQALREILAQQPDLAVLDIRMPKLSGLRLLREMQLHNLKTDVIFLTMYDDPETFNEALDLGVMGYVSKESAVTDVVAAIETVAHGRHFISPSLMELMVARSTAGSARPRKRPLDLLTPTERRILSHIAESMTSKEIAEVLCVSQRTIENHRAHIGAKLGVHGSYSLLKFAIENKSNL